MALNIKNPKAIELATQISRFTGENLTQAVIISLQERLEHLQGRRTVPLVAKAILDISKRCKNLPDLDPRTPEEILEYSPTGMFK
jgi:antitoxin VapB